MTPFELPMTRREDVAAGELSWAERVVGGPTQNKRAGIRRPFLVATFCY